MKKILLVQLFSNGDCLYATAVARQIKLDFPGCHLTWAIASFCKDILDGNPYIDEVLTTDAVGKKDVKAFRRFKRMVLEKKNSGEYDEVFVTHIEDSNIANYDGCIRSALFRGYPSPITVPVTPVLRLKNEETEKVRSFVSQHQLQGFSQVVLFEFAPQSGQLNINNEIAIRIAEGIAAGGNTAVILSSGTAIAHPDARIIDGSRLSLRETAGLTHYCTLLLGCSSGITWISTSDAARLLPMVQLIDAKTKWINPLSRDFQRFHLPADQVIDLVDFDERLVIDCVIKALPDFKGAKKRYGQTIPLQFNTTWGIVYNLLCYRQFGAILRHVKINREVYGDNVAFYAQVMKGFLIFPFRLVRNMVVKRSGLFRS